MEITNKRQLLINKQIGWMDNDKFFLLFTITKFSTDGKKYYRTYDDGTGQWMLTNILLKNLDSGKFKCPELQLTVIYSICNGRQKTPQEKQFDRQLSYYENYGTIKQGKL